MLCSAQPRLLVGHGEAASSSERRRPPALPHRRLPPQPGQPAGLGEADAPGGRGAQRPLLQHLGRGRHPAVSG